jgi:predicted P-loop ATPase
MILVLKESSPWKLFETQSEAIDAIVIDKAKSETNEELYATQLEDYEAYKVEVGKEINTEEEVSINLFPD